MKKLWFLALLGIAVLSCGPTNAQLRAQTSLPSIPEEAKPKAKIQCKIVVKRYAVSEKSHKPVPDTKVIIVKDQSDLPRPARYLVLGSMTVEAGKDCFVVEIIDAIKAGAGTYGANYVLPWTAQEGTDEQVAGPGLGVEGDTSSAYILLRSKELSI